MKKVLFNLSSILNPQQVEVIDPALTKLDCLVEMSTGGGKSTCFLLPGLFERGVTFVVSPLKSLMFDQVNYLKSLAVIKMNNHFNYMCNLLKCCFR
jgi:bloom syndrome protein